jgi:GT2 family glycosyltransferase/acetyltransferase-like isoleucine patch superfamily enzyme
MNHPIENHDDSRSPAVSTEETEQSSTLPIFSIVILTRNRGHFLPRTLKAVFAHKGPSREVLIFDNGSTDNTAAIAREFPLRYFFTPELGLGEMRQRGLEASRGEFVVMYDDDCLPQSGWLEKFLDRFRADDTLALIGGRIINVGFKGISMAKGSGGFGRNGQIISNVPIDHADYFGCANLALRRSAALQVGFDSFLVCGYEEGDIGQGLQKLGYRIGYGPDAAVDHHNVSATQRDRWRWRHNGVMRVYFYLKHFRPSGLGWLRFLGRECRIQLHSLLRGRNAPVHCRLLATAAIFCLLPKVAFLSHQSRRRLLAKESLAGHDAQRLTAVAGPAREGEKAPARKSGFFKRNLESAVSCPVFAPLAAYRIGLLSFRTVSEALAFLPGKLGVIWRRAWYRRTLHACGDRLVVEWMSVFRSPTASVGDRVYVGPFCWISRTHLGNEVMLAGRVTVLSGKAQHGTARLDVPMRQQEGRMVDVHIGRDVWVGDSAVIMTDVADGTVVGAGSIVTTRFEPYSIIAGNPAKFIKLRGPRQEIAA